jgi:hypothetical protein
LLRGQISQPITCGFATLSERPDSAQHFLDRLVVSIILAMRRFSTIISMFVAAAATFAILAYKNATALKL